MPVLRPRAPGAILVRELAQQRWRSFPPGTSLANRRLRTAPRQRGTECIAGKAPTPRVAPDVPHPAPHRIARPARVSTPPTWEKPRRDDLESPPSPVSVRSAAPPAAGQKSSSSRTRRRCRRRRSNTIRRLGRVDQSCPRRGIRPPAARRRRKLVGDGRVAGWAKTRRRRRPHLVVPSQLVGRSRPRPSASTIDLAARSGVAP